MDWTCPCHSPLNKKLCQVRDVHTCLMHDAHRIFQRQSSCMPISPPSLQMKYGYHACCVILLTILLVAVGCILQNLLRSCLPCQHDTKSDIQETVPRRVQAFPLPGSGSVVLPPYLIHAIAQPTNCLSHGIGAQFLASGPFSERAPRGPSRIYRQPSSP